MYLLRNYLSYFIILFVALMLLGCGSKKNDDEAINPENALLKGWSEYADGNYAMAILSFESVINSDAESGIFGDAYNGIGWSYSCLSSDVEVNKANVSTALKKFESALEHDRLNADAWVGMATMLMVKRGSDDDLRNAIKAVDNALEGGKRYLYRHDYDSNADLYALKAQCYYYLNDIDNAKKEANRCLAIERMNGSALAIVALMD